MGAGNARVGAGQGKMMGGGKVIEEKEGLGSGKVFRRLQETEPRFFRGIFSPDVKARELGGEVYPVVEIENGDGRERKKYSCLVLG